MNKFLPKEYFDLTNFAHREVFFEDKLVWETLKNIKSYIEQRFDNGDIEKQIPEAKNLSCEGNNIFIGEGTKIFPNVFIGNNVIIGKNCEIRPGAFIRENVIISNNCVVGNSSELKNTIMLDGAKAPHFNYVGDSIIGKNCNLGAGTVTGNLRFDDAEVKIRVDDELVGTSLRKFGVILGDESQTGCHAVTNPGTIVGKNAILSGSMSHKGVIPERSKVHQ